MGDFISRNNPRIRREYTQISYKLGDNDFYYFHLPDKSGAYVIHEKQLYDHGFISKAHARKRISL